MRSIAANVLTILIVLGIVFLGVLGYAQRQIAAPGPATEAVSIVVDRGARFDQVAQELADAGVIGDPLLFRLAARYKGKAGQLKFGEYRFRAGASMAKSSTSSPSVGMCPTQ